MSIASCERSFSELKLILNYLRQERLTALAQQSLERKTFKELKFDDVINDFATQKARKADI